MPNIFIRPKKGFQIRDMTGAIVPPHGVEVENNSFWTRKVADKDMERITEDEFNKGKKAFEKAAAAEAKQLLDEQSTPPAGA